MKLIEGALESPESILFKYKIFIKIFSLPGLISAIFRPGSIRINYGRNLAGERPGNKDKGLGSFTLS